MDYVPFGPVKVSRFILGTNMISGFSHVSPEKNREMMRYYTADRIKQTFREAEALGVTALVGRAGFHILRVLMEHWDEGGTIQWFAQTAAEVTAHTPCVDRAAFGGAKGCHIHGGVMDFLYAQNRLEEIRPVIELIRERGMLAGVAGHNPKVFEWAERNLDLDYYMCSYYNAARRDERPDHVPGMKEWFHDEDRRIMRDLIQTLSRPVIHFKVLAAGRNDPAEAFAHVAQALRPQDAVCVGVYAKDKPDMLREDVALLYAALEARAAASHT